MSAIGAIRRPIKKPPDAPFLWDTLVSEDQVNQEQWTRLQSEFDYLHRLLKSQGEDAAGVAPLAAVPAAPAPAAEEQVDPGADLTEAERMALESVDQTDIDSTIRQW